MIETADVILFAARHGLIVQPSVVRDALHTLDRESYLSTERSRWRAVMWNGQGNPPVGTRDRWIHDQDAIGRATQEAFATGHVVYWLFRDDQLHYYQPFVAYERGRILLTYHNKAHPDHWERRATQHIEREVERVVDQQMLRDALTRTLELHEARGIPVGGTWPPHRED